MPSFLRDGAIVAGGALAAQVVSVTFYPLITRLFEPATFGVFAAIVAFLSVATPVASLRFNAVLMIPVERERIWRLYWVGVSACGITSLATGLGVLAGSWLDLPIGALSPARNSEWWAAPALLFLGGLYQLEFARVTRLRGFRTLAAARVVETGADRLLAIVLGLLQFGASGLLVGRFAGLLGGTWLLNRQARGNRRKNEGQSGTSIQYLVDDFRRYRAIALSSSLSSLVDAVGRYAPQMAIPVFFSLEGNGHLALAMFVVAMPMTLLGDAVASVFAERSAAVRGGPNSIGQLAANVNFASFVLLCPVPAALALIGAEAFAFVFGSEWRGSGVLAALLAVSLYAAFVHRVFGVLFELHALTLVRLRFDVASTVVRIAVLVIAGMSGVALTPTVAAFYVVSAVFYLSAVVWLFRRLGLPFFRKADLAAVGLVATAVVAAIGVAASPATWWWRVVVTCALLVIILGIGARRLWPLVRDSHGQQVT